MTIDTIHDDKSLYLSQKKYKFQSDIFEKVFQKMSTTQKTKAFIEKIKFYHFDDLLYSEAGIQ